MFDFKYLAIGFAIFVSACSATKHDADLSGIRIYYDKTMIRECDFKGDIIGSGGRWFNYLFISNKDLSYAALNDLKFAASVLGANAVHLPSDISFNTSVTFLGQAYKCH